MKKISVSNLLLSILFLAGLSLVLYPTVSDWWNSRTQSRAVEKYTKQVMTMEDHVYDEVLDAARAYNRCLLTKINYYAMTEEEMADYESQLNITGTGIMGYVEIPKINCALPIYHGSGEDVLRTAVGHVEWSSLPVGGQGTHCVLSAHRGLPSARLFTDLDKLEVGDTFVLRILDATLTYEVDQILVVLPEELDALKIDPEADFCTLVTCTPYGINTHRMLVRGHRVENDKEA